MSETILITLPLWAWYALLICAACGVGGAAVMSVRFVAERLVAWQFRHEAERSR